MNAKRQWRLHASVLLCVLVSSLDTPEGHPLSSSLLFNDLFYDEPTPSDDDPVYRTHGHYSLHGGSHSLAQPPLPSQVFPTENENNAGKFLGRRKSHGRVAFRSGEEELKDGEDERYKCSGLKQRNRIHDNRVAPLSRDQSIRNEDGEMTGSTMKRSSSQLKSSKRLSTAAIRGEGHVHPIFLGYGQETSGAALNTLARLLAEEEHLRRLNPTDRTKESIRFIG